jgi:ACS family glucarate transporter-like MFS transporter
MLLAANWTGAADRWRPVFFIYALVGLAWSAAFWLWFRDNPNEHRDCNQAEIDLIRGDEAQASHSETARSIPLVALFTHRSLLLLSLIMFLINVGWIFIGTWLPTYLIQVHGLSESRAGFYTSLTAASGMAGCLLGGVATDVLRARFGVAWGRRIPGMISYGGAALGLLGVWVMDDVEPIVALLIVTSFLGDFALGAIWATAQDIGGPLAGTVLGTGNMCGNIGAAVAISAIARLQAAYGWPITFIMSAAAYAIAAVLWLGVDPRQPLKIDKNAVAVPND